MMRTVPFLVPLLAFAASVPVLAQPRAKLSPETVRAFDAYTRSFDRLQQRRLEGRLPFLWTDDDPRRRVRLRGGEILVDSGDDTPDINGGLLHDWLGAMFVPEATAEEVLGVLQDYDRHKEWYPEVVDSRLLGRDGDTLRGFQRLVKTKVLTAVLNTEHEASYHKVGDSRWFGRSVSTRIAEVKDAGEPGERELPVGNDSGFLWRLNAYWRLEQTDDGVFVECVTISLSRGIPWGVGWMIRPIVTSLPRESLEGVMQATRLAVKSNQQQ